MGDSYSYCRLLRRERCWFPYGRIIGCIVRHSAGFVEGGQLTAAAPGVSIRNEVSPGEVTVLFCGRHPYQEELIVTLEGFMYGLGRGLLFWL